MENTLTEMGEAAKKFTKKKCRKENLLSNRKYFKLIFHLI